MRATFDFGDKYRQMESSDVIKKIFRVINRSLPFSHSHYHYRSFFAKSRYFDVLVP
jgi:hypothetical protein